jgi:hypothetical protein
VIHNHPAIPASTAASKMIISFAPHNHLNHEPETMTTSRRRSSGPRNRLNHLGRLSNHLSGLIHEPECCPAPTGERSGLLCASDQAVGPPQTAGVECEAQKQATCPRRAAEQEVQRSHTEPRRHQQAQHREPGQ